MGTETPVRLAEITFYYVLWRTRNGMPVWVEYNTLEDAENSTPMRDKHAKAFIATKVGGYGPEHGNSGVLTQGKE